MAISVAVDDVAALVYFQKGLELGIGDDVHSGRQRVTEMHLEAQVALLYQMEACRKSLRDSPFHSSCHTLPGS